MYPRYHRWRYGRRRRRGFRIRIRAAVTPPGRCARRPHRHRGRFGDSATRTELPARRHSAQRGDLFPAPPLAPRPGRRRVLVEGFASNAPRNPKRKFQRMNHALPPHLPSNRSFGWTLR